MRSPIILFISLIFFTAQAQIKPSLQTVDSTSNDAARMKQFNFKNKKEKEEKKEIVYGIEDYKIISYQRDTIAVDTSLTIQKEYRYNFLRRDDFELLPMANLGQGYNRLGYQFLAATYPKMGARARHFGYFEKEDVVYYHVPTPSTELFFKTTFEQGQLLDAAIALNTSKEFNFSLSYKSMRSLGKYRHIESNHGNFRFTANYQSKNKKYRMRTHFLTQDMESQENGGLAIPDQFTSGDSQFRDRSRIDVRYQNAVGKLKGNAYYLDQEYEITSTKDTIQRTSLYAGSESHFETKFYRFEQTAAHADFGTPLVDEITDLSRLQTFYNQAYVKLYNPYLGDLMPFARAYHYNYYFNSVLRTPSGSIANKLEATEYAFGALWSKQLGGFDVEAKLVKNLSGDISGDAITAKAAYVFGPYQLEAQMQWYSKMPNFNFLLNHSDYLSFNWSNSLKKEDYANIDVGLMHKKWGSLKVQYNRIGNYTFFQSSSPGEETALADVRPVQSDEELQYLKIGFENQVAVGKFSLHNTILYQNVTQDRNIFNVPQLVTRNTLAFSSDLFDKALWLQTGFTFKYFSAYYADGYHPVLGEFYSQDKEEVGGYPMLDFFVNFKVRRTRIYLKAEHFNSSFTGNEFYSAPNYPYRDFVVRFGLVWNFFS
ncbi:MAG: putative porin [Flavobacteriaceae bacterium]|nr:putative porin [Flavobacteriaceae bacterium]